jgi:hypothetical protein
MNSKMSSPDSRIGGRRFSGFPGNTEKPGLKIKSSKLAHYERIRVSGFL